MFSKTPLILCAMTLTLPLGLLLGPASGGDPKELRVTAKIVDKFYCKADNQLFTMSVKMKVRVLNLSKESVEIRGPLVPWVARVATNMKEAQAGHFIFEVTRSYYAQKREPPEILRIDRGMSLDIDAGYDFVARYDDSFSYPKSLSAGTYAVVLVFKPQASTPSNGKRDDLRDSLTTDPFPLEVQKAANVLDCMSGRAPRGTQLQEKLSTEPHAR